MHTEHICTDIYTQYIYNAHTHIQNIYAYIFTHNINTHTHIQNIYAYIFTHNIYIYNT